MSLICRLYLKEHQSAAHKYGFWMISSVLLTASFLFKSHFKALKTDLISLSDFH